jgi:Holliday junction resolvase RusA-like endonuclease
MKVTEDEYRQVQEMRVEFWVHGIPQTKGSARAFLPKKGARYPVVTNDNPKNKKWARSVKIAAQNAMAKQEMGMIPGAVKLNCVFYVPQPKRVKSGLELSTTRPDLDKMVRSVGDALEGVCYKNDSQVAGVVATKFYSLKPGLYLTVETFGVGEV